MAVFFEHPVDPRISAIGACHTVSVTLLQFVEIRISIDRPTHILRLLFTRGLKSPTMSHSIAIPRDSFYLITRWYQVFAMLYLGA